MAFLTHRPTWRPLTLCAVILGMLVASPGSAYINQIDGSVVPNTDRMQRCLDRAASGETSPGLVDAIEDAAILPEAYRPVASTNYVVSFRAIGEGGGYRNSFGWYWIGDDVSDPNNLHTVFGCRNYTSECACPCNRTHRQVQVDFTTETGFAPGRAIGFWLRTPERFSGGEEGGTADTSCDFDRGCDPPAGADACGARRDVNNRIYFTSKTLNDDGDFVHFLVYESESRANTYYFGFEDLFRGGDNDFEDMLVRAQGLVPLCDPQPETCDNADNDCDGAVDENLLQACSTTCENGVRICSAGSYGACNARQPTPEDCDAIDNDCDDSIDEGLTRACSNVCGSGTEVCTLGVFGGCDAPTQDIETCDGVDNDCDGSTDEDLTRNCSTACGTGTEVCSAGSYSGCDAPLPTQETCDGVDNDCNGLTDDGITRPCSSACGEGIEVCIQGSFVGCTAEAPTLEICNDADDDCDGEVDEKLTRTCASGCGTGVRTCTAGVYGECSAPAGTAEVCNNIDDDCNGVIDDGNPDGGDACIPTTDGYVLASEVQTEDTCSPGTTRCTAGELRCVGAGSVTRELCNCRDDDCDGEVDEGDNASLCGGGVCLDCQCVSPCADNEFPCPLDKRCDRTLADPDAGIVGLCVAGPCTGVVCEEEEFCDVQTGECKNLCTDVECPEGFACIRGGCVEDNCYGRGCPAGQVCQDGTCGKNPCADVRCGAGEFCREGECLAVCQEACGAGRTCKNGECRDAPCGGACDAGQTCVDDACVDNVCNPQCGVGRRCVAGTCEDDPCRTVKCPDGYACSDGECMVREVDSDQDLPPRKYVQATGGGGCACSIGPGPGQTASAPLLLLVGGILLRLRRRRRRGTVGGRRAAMVALAVLSLWLLGGCSVDPFCVDCIDPAAGRGSGGRSGGDGGRSGGDGGRSGGGGVGVDACVALTDEVCNGGDDDCDGRIDEGFDRDSDPNHCGSCGRACAFPNAFPVCMDGTCLIESCEVGFTDLNDTPGDGCEYACINSGAELCDEQDNDCDGVIDEGIDLQTSLEHCGACGDFCSYANADAACVDGECVKLDCRDGFVDLNDDDVDGCEVRCTATGTEICNREDDDCNGSIDEGFDLESDPDNCGFCGTRCELLNAEAACVDGACTLVDCVDGFFDADDNVATGCEYACVPDGDERCNGADDDCDGLVDEDDPGVGQPCGGTGNTGACREGTTTCQLGGIACVGARGPQPEVCNGVDDNCNGATDEADPQLGVRCGPTDVGVCEYGTIVCDAGTLRCGGAFVASGDETCDGLDNDCNGAADDGLTAPTAASVPSCAEQRGVCAGGVPTCRGAGGWGCDLPAEFQGDESRCDALDNDCDGATDEGCLEVAGAGDQRIDTQNGANANNSLSPRVAGNGDERVFVTWMEVESGAARAYFKRSSNQGDSFGGIELLDSGGGAAMAPRIGYSGSNRVSVAWADFRGDSGNDRQIFAAHSTNNGGDFGTDFALSTGTSASQDSLNVEVATAGNNVYAVYESFEASRRRQVYFVASSDGGQSFSAPQKLSTQSGASYVAARARVAAAGDNVYVLWRDNRSGPFDIYLRRSTNAGQSFGSEVRIDTGEAAGANTSFAPELAAEGDNVYAVWVDDRFDGSFDIYLNRSLDAGATWLSDAMRLDQDPFGHDSIEPQVVVTGPDRAVVAWLDYRSGLPDPTVVVTDNAFLTISTPTRLDTGTGAGESGSYDLSIDADGDLVVAAWADDRNGLLDIYANVSLDGGATFQPADYRLDSSDAGTSDSQTPHVYVGGGAGHVVWTDHRCGSSTCANGDIYHRALRQP